MVRCYIVDRCYRVDDDDYNVLARRKSQGYGYFVWKKDDNAKEEDRGRHSRNGISFNSRLASIIWYGSSPLRDLELCRCDVRDLHCTCSVGNKLCGNASFYTFYRNRRTRTAQQQHGIFHIFPHLAPHALILLHMLLFFLFQWRRQQGLRSTASTGLHHWRRQCLWNMSTNMPPSPAASNTFPLGQLR